MSFIINVRDYKIIIKYLMELNITYIIRQKKSKGKQKKTLFSKIGKRAKNLVLILSIDLNRYNFSERLKFVLRTNVETISC